MPNFHNKAIYPPFKQHRVDLLIQLEGMFGVRDAVGQFEGPQESVVLERECQSKHLMRICTTTHQKGGMGEGDNGD